MYTTRFTIFDSFRFSPSISAAQTFHSYCYLTEETKIQSEIKIEIEIDIEIEIEIGIGCVIRTMKQAATANFKAFADNMCPQLCIPPVQDLLRAMMNIQYASLYHTTISPPMN